MADVKISSYNIHSCVGTDGIYSVDRVARVIRCGGADIVCLQEVEVNDLSMQTRIGTDLSMQQTRIWSSQHMDNQSSAIATLAGMQYHVFAPAIRSRASSRYKEMHDVVSSADVSGNFSDEKWNRTCTSETNEQSSCNNMGKFGIAILSRYPIVQVRIHQYKRYKHKTIRNAMAVLISLPNNTLIWIVNTHLGCHFIGKEQHAQSKELVSFISSLERKINSKNIVGVILCGDLNSPPMFRSIKTIHRAGLHDSWSLIRGQRVSVSGGTFPSDAKVFGMTVSCFRKLIRLDYIFVHEHCLPQIIVCTCVYVQDDSYECSLASDHLPVCAVFVIEKR